MSTTQNAAETSSECSREKDSLPLVRGMPIQCWHDSWNIFLKPHVQKSAVHKIFHELSDVFQWKLTTISSYFDLKRECIAIVGKPQCQR